MLLECFEDAFRWECLVGDDLGILSVVGLWGSFEVEMLLGCYGDAFRWRCFGDAFRWACLGDTFHRGCLGGAIRCGCFWDALVMLSVGLLSGGDAFGLL